MNWRAGKEKKPILPPTKSLPPTPNNSPDRPPEHQPGERVCFLQPGSSASALEVFAEPATGQQKPPELTPNSQVAENTPVRQVDVDFHGNELTGQFATNVYGKDVYITISGRLASKDGYATFDPTGFKFGNLSIPVSLVNDTLQKKLAEPENREKLKLPDFVQSIRIENGELVVEEKN